MVHACTLRHTNLRHSAWGYPELALLAAAGGPPRRLHLDPIRPGSGSGSFILVPSCPCTCYRIGILGLTFARPQSEEGVEGGGELGEGGEPGSGSGPVGGLVANCVRFCLFLFSGFINAQLHERYTTRI